MAKTPTPAAVQEKRSYSGARTDALDPNEGARHQKEIRGINGRVRSAPARPNAGTNYQSAVTTTFSHFLYASR